MSAAMTRLSALDVPGGRGRAACARLGEHGRDLAAALRKAVPFLARRHVEVKAETPACKSFADLAADTTVVHAASFAVGGSRLRGVVLIDDAALGRIVDAVFGGEGAASIGSGAPTSAQTALASRVCTAMMRGFAEVLAAKLGITIAPTTAKELDAGTAVVLTLSLGGGGRVMLALPLGAIAVGPASEEPESIDAGIADALVDVEIDVVVELGKVRMPLEAIANLAVGDVVRLSLSLDTRVLVRAGGAVLFQGRPTASGDAVAVSLERRAA